MLILCLFVSHMIDLMSMPRSIHITHLFIMPPLFVRFRKGHFQAFPTNQLTDNTYNTQYTYMEQFNLSEMLFISGSVRTFIRGLSTFVCYLLCIIVRMSSLFWFAFFCFNFI